MSEAERARMRQQMIDRMIEQAQLTEEQRQAVRQTLAAKDQARQALTEELNNLRRTANQANPTEEQLRTALEAYQAALTRYREKVQAIDAALVKQLPVGAQVRCMSLGILENGLGPMGMRRGAGAQPGRGGQPPRRGAA